MDNCCKNNSYLNLVHLCHFTNLNLIYRYAVSCSFILSKKVSIFWKFIILQKKDKQATLLVNKHYIEIHDTKSHLFFLWLLLQIIIIFILTRKVMDILYLICIKLPHSFIPNKLSLEVCKWGLYHLLQWNGH